jgi:tryptophan synthase alpha chain
MTYFNVAFRRGVEQFSREMREVGVKGAIILDLPYEEGTELLAAMAKDELEPIYLYAPTTSEARRAEIAKRASGFIYCIARKGVTGAKTDFAALDGYLQRCRKATNLPLALGFGVSERADVAAITGKVDIAVVGSETLRVLDRDGVSGVRPFIESLRA